MEIYQYIEIVEDSEGLRQVRPPIADREAEQLLRELRVERGLEDYRTLVEIASEFVIEDRREARMVLNGLREQSAQIQTTTPAVC